MNNYKVSFQYSEYTYCTNIAIAENIQDVENHYSKYAWYNITEATDSDMKEAERKGMSIITINHVEEEREEENMETTTRTIEEIKNEIINYFTENEDEFNEVIEELDSYNGYLGDDRYFNMDDLDEMLYGLTPTEILNRTFYGGDDDTKDARGNRGEFNPNREYFYYNGYGNLVSTDYKDYTCHLDEYFINDLIENHEQLWDVPEEVITLIEELQELEENE